MYRMIAIGAVAAALAACQTMGGLTVKDYTAKSGQRVRAGQAEPKAEYACAKVAQERAEWGIKGNMDKVGAMERVTNYAYIMAPGEASIGGFNVNAFKDAQVAYYKCASLPAASR